MNKIRTILALVTFFLCASITLAQDSKNPWEVDFGANAIVFYPMASINNPSISNYIGGFVNVRQHYNYYGLPLRLHVGRYIAKDFSLGVALSINKIHKMGGPISERAFFNFDTDLRYDLNALFGDLNIIKNLVIDPYTFTGLGYTSVGSAHIGSLNLGGGINFWTSKSKNFGFQVQSTGKLNLKGTISSYFQHSFGVVFKFGEADTDKDGLKDSKDKCPTKAGLIKFMGCPDTDGDGIKDSEDKCPHLAGTKELSGCPDKDNDGIRDKDDYCPDVPGIKAGNGCPDTDGDGVVDKNDACINKAGAKKNKGCPWPDTDGDGVLDKDDKCKNTAGLASNNGCKKEIISAKANLLISDYAKTVVFVSNHSSFAKGVTKNLDKIVRLLKKFDKTILVINGYTDSVGSKKYNLWLSERRANAVMKYLINHGINANRLSAKGFGEASPIDDNKTSKGRANNRRVEIQVVNKK